MMIFQFQLGRRAFQCNPWAFENGYIEGDLQIFVEGRMYFDEPYMNVVELAVQLGNWLDSIRHGILRNFVYDSLDSEESLLQFFVQQESVQVYSPIEKVKIQPLPIETVKNAVIRYLVALNVKLHEIDYIQKLDCFLYNNLSENAKALMLFEQNEYAEALALFKKLVEDSPSVQSFNNLAWIYLREEEEMDEAEKLLKQVLNLNPQSPFPYMMLGEIALHKSEFERAKTQLETALTHGFTEEATYNLAMAHFKLEEYQQAAQTFASCDGDSGRTQLNEVVAWMYAGQQAKAKELLDVWNEDAYDYTGAIEIADVYAEMQYYAEAREQFEKEWRSDIHHPYIVSRFAYTLLQLGDVDACQSILQQAVLEIGKEIGDVQEEEADEHWTTQDKLERIEELTEQKQELETFLDLLQNGYVPAFEYDMYPMSGCQLFGCLQHGHAEYEDAKMDPELIKHYAYELHGHLPEETQQEAKEWLIANTSQDQLALLFPPYAKSCWQNAMKVIEAIGYPQNEAAFPRIVELFQDINWPGAEEAVSYFQTVEKAVVVPYIEAGGKQAMAERDWQWFWFLYEVCERLSIERADFEQTAVFDAMKECYDTDG